MDFNYAVSFIQNVAKSIHKYTYLLIALTLKLDFFYTARPKRPKLKIFDNNFSLISPADLEINGLDKWTTN